MNKEVWKDIKIKKNSKFYDFEGTYQISNYGAVKNIKINKLLTPLIDKNGYIIYSLVKNKKSSLFKAHRLVAETFIQNVENKPQVNHKDGNKKNNYVENLEWVTNGENSKHAWETKLKTKKYRNENHNSKKVLQFTLDGNFIKEYDCIKDAVIKLHLKSHTNISQCIHKKQKSAYGYIWKLKEE